MTPPHVRHGYVSYHNLLPKLAGGDRSKALEPLDIEHERDGSSHLHFDRAG